VGLFRRKREPAGESAPLATPDRAAAPLDPDEAPPPAPADPGFSEAVEGVAAGPPGAPPASTVADPADPLAPPLGPPTPAPPDPLPAAPPGAGLEPAPAPVEPLTPPGAAAAGSAAAAGTAAAAEGVGGSTALEEPEVPVLGPDRPAEDSPSPDLGERPEIWVGAAFAGGLVLAAVLRWLSSRD
jgi:hypothetical protein